MTNLVRTKEPSPHNAFSIASSATRGLETVRIALEKCLTTEEYERVLNGYRRSDATVTGVITDFMRIDIPRHKIVRDEHYLKALEIVRLMFQPPRKYRPVHFTDLRYYPWPLSSSVEAPFSDDSSLRQRVLEAHRRGELPNPKLSFRNCYNEVFVRNRFIVHEIKEGKAKGDRFFSYAKAHARAHLVEEIDEDKVRMVYGIPKLLLMVELMLLWPLMQWFRHGHTPLAWGFEILQGGFYKLQVLSERWSYKLETVLALDWKQFDKRVSFELIDDIHKIWRDWIVMDQGYIPTKDYPVTTTKAERIDNLFTWMSHAVKFMPIRLPDGSEWKRRFASIGSGLMQTQILDSFANCIMLLTCLSAIGFDVSPGLFLKVMGDDSLIGLRERIPENEFESFLSKFHDEAERRFGAILNVKKSRITRSLEGTHFLGFTNMGTRPIRDPYALLAQLLYPERRVTMSKLMARAIGIVYADAGHTKVVYNVCKEVYLHGASLGYTPDEEEVDVLYFLQGFRPDLSQFPTIEMTQSRLMLPPGQEELIRNKFWNADHFLAEY